MTPAGTTSLTYEELCELADAMNVELSANTERYAAQIEAARRRIEELRLSRNTPKRQGAWSPKKSRNRKGEAK